MKKLIYSMLALATMALTFTSCEDVPAPYANPNQGLPAGVLLKETFASGEGAFTIVTSKGNAWVNNYSTMTATGYDSKAKTNTASESYLISPYMNLSKTSAAYIQFKYIYRYSKNAGENKVLISTDYKGDPTTATWTDITGTLTEGNNWEDFSTYTKNLDAKFLADSVVVALYYNADSTGSRTWEVKNFYVLEGTASATEENAGGNTGDITGGTLDKPYTVAEALAIIKSGKATDKEVYILGTISTVKSIDIYNGAASGPGSWGNAEYYISDDGTTTNQLQVYHGYYLDENKDGEGDKFTDATAAKLTVGKKVLLCGKLTLFNTTPEIAAYSYIVKFVEGESGGGSTGGDATGDILNVPFTDSNLGGFTTVDVNLGTLSFVWADGTKYGWKATSFKGECIAAESWLISPAMDLSKRTSATLTFEQALNQLKGGTLSNHISVLVSTNYTSGAPSTATWTALTLDKWPEGTNWTFITSTASLAAYAGKSNVRIALKYVGTTEYAPTWEIKNFVVK